MFLQKQGRNNRAPRTEKTSESKMQILSSIPSRQLEVKKPTRRGREYILITRHPNKAEIVDNTYMKSKQILN